MVMKKLSVFNFLTLNGFYKGLNEDISWHRHGSDEAEFAAQGARIESTLLFGRKTFELMASYWPSPQGMKDNPDVAEGMNKSQKIVLSRTLKTATWQNSQIICSNAMDEIRGLKEKGDKDMTVLGSGTVVAQLADAGLIDIFQFMVDPVVLGKGTPVLEGINQSLNLKLIDSKIFRSGVVLLTYESMKN
jgi:dihydrofolate reductase